MFFDQLELIPQIALKNGTALFVVPATFTPDYMGALYLRPEEKKTITIEQVRKLLARLGRKQKTDQIIVIDRVELLNDESANALLKNLEEPQEKVHFVLLSSEISTVMPTILSRSAIFLYRENYNFEEISADDTIRELAKKLLVVKNRDLVRLTDEITAKKDRQFVLAVIDAAIQMLYKSYFLTKKPIFLKKIVNFLQIYEKISQNGQLKLQIIANLC